MEDEDIGVTIVHRNLLLPLYSDPSDQTGEPDNNRSLVDPKETMDTQVAIIASAIASHVHNLSAYEGAQVANMFQRGLEYVTALFWKYLDPSGPATVDLYNCLHRYGFRVI